MVTRKQYLQAMDQADRKVPNPDPKNAAILVNHRRKIEAMTESQFQQHMAEMRKALKSVMESGKPIDRAAVGAAMFGA